MLKRFAAALGVLAALLFASPAYATDAYPVESECLTGWYVNGDEEHLLPESTVDGLVFDGPSLVHRRVDPALPLADVEGGWFEASAVQGVEPLFKLESNAPYSTVNVLADGTVWSSKIPTGPGSQGAPVASVADLAALAPYTADSVVITFGVGYANDAGNKATVTSISFGGTTYDMTCQPEASPSATPSAPATSNPPVDPTSEPPVEPSTSPEAALPVTGTNPLALIPVGVAAVLLGIAAVIVVRRRRNRFEA